MHEVFDRFVERSPFSVLNRVLMERLFADSFLNRIFEEHAQEQYHKTLAFSTISTLLTQVVLRYRPSLRNAYHRSERTIEATLKSVYGKLRLVEPRVCQALVEQTAERAHEVIDQWPDAIRPAPILGLRLRILDGNYLAGTRHRIKELRDQGAAALPGMSVVMRDDRTGLLTRLICREDAYTNERALIDDLLEWVERDDLIVADRNFCCSGFLAGIARRLGFFVIRHHQSMTLKERTALRACGRSSTGEVYEQQVEVGPEGSKLRLRCVLIRLFEPTREGETEIRLLSNVPPERATAGTLADIYFRRWTIEHSFQELTDQLQCEVNTLGYPKAALFGFSLAICAYNLWAALKGALARAWGLARVEAELSVYAMAQEIRQDSSGLAIALPESWCQRFAKMPFEELAEWLVRIAQAVPWERYKKSKSKRKSSKPSDKKNKGGRKDPHRSTARILLERSQMSQ